MDSDNNYLYSELGLEPSAIGLDYLQDNPLHKMYSAPDNLCKISETKYDVQDGLEKNILMLENNISRFNIPKETLVDAISDNYLNAASNFEYLPSVESRLEAINSSNAWTDIVTFPNIGFSNLKPYTRSDDIFGFNMDHCHIRTVKSSNPFVDSTVRNNINSQMSGLNFESCAHPNSNLVRPDIAPFSNGNSLCLDGSAVDYEEEPLILSEAHNDLSKKVGYPYENNFALNSTYGFDRAEANNYFLNSDVNNLSILAANRFACSNYINNPALDVEKLGLYQTSNIENLDFPTESISKYGISPYFDKIKANNNTELFATTRFNENENVIGDSPMLNFSVDELNNMSALHGGCINNSFTSSIYLNEPMIGVDSPELQAIAPRENEFITHLHKQSKLLEELNNEVSNLTLNKPIFDSSILEINLKEDEFVKRLAVLEPKLTEMYEGAIIM